MKLAREASVRKPKKNKSGGYILDEDIFSARRTPSKPLPQIPRSASTPLFSASNVFNLPTPPGGKPLPLNPRQLEDIEEEFELEDLLESMRFNPEELEFDSPRALNLSAKNPFSFLGNPEDVNWKSVYRLVRGENPNLNLPENPRQKPYPPLPTPTGGKPLPRIPSKPLPSIPQMISNTASNITSTTRKLGSTLLGSEPIYTFGSGSAIPRGDFTTSSGTRHIAPKMKVSRKEFESITDKELDELLSEIDIEDD